MDKSQVRSHFEEALVVLQHFMASEDNFKVVEAAGIIMSGALAQGHKIISCGNGGSMSDAMHFAEELTGRYRLNRPAQPAMAISDPAYLTCVANDFGYDAVFNRFVEAFGQSGDVLLAISTSGNSVNVLKAAQTALKQDMKVVALTGKDGGKLADACTVEIRIAHLGFADRIQEMHIKIIHCLIDFIEQKLALNKQKVE